MLLNLGELDNLISSVPHARFISCPIFGGPVAAAEGSLVAVMSGDYRSKKEVAYLFVPAAGRKIIDLGGNVEKGSGFHLSPQCFLNIHDSSHIKTFWKLSDPWDYGSHG